MDFYSASTLKQHAAGFTCRSWLRTHFDFDPTSLCSFSLMLGAYRRRNKYQIVYSLVWSDRGTNPWSTALEVSMLVIIPLKQLTLYIYIISHYSSFLKQNFEFTCSLAAAGASTCSFNSWDCSNSCDDTSVRQRGGRGNKCHIQYNFLNTL